MKTTRIVALCLFASLCCGQIGFAQNTGKIVGRVTDADTGDPLPGANVVVVGTMLGSSTELDGRFLIMRVPPGKYDVKAMFIGYQDVTYQDVEIMTDLTSTVDFALKSEVLVGEEVVIVASPPVIRKDLTSSEARVQAEEIEKMPVQELGDLLNIQAGISRDAGGGIHIRGGRSSEVSYLVNGISVTDDFYRSQALQIENESIQELQVISGTFNAEYGNAMSGIINVVTKSGGNSFRGSAEIWAGDYISGRDDIFYNIDDYDPTDTYNLQGSLSGPIFKDRVSFFVTGRRWSDDGWLYGINRYRPQGRTTVVDGDTVAAFGDDNPVAMNARDLWSGQASLDFNISQNLKLKVDALGSTENARYYNHFFRFNPHGYRGDESAGLSVISKFTHLLGGATFHEITLAYKYNELSSKLYDDPYDARYVHPDSLSVGSLQFAKAGTDLGRFKRTSQSRILKWDLTSQVTRRHQMKTGLELQFDKVYYQDISLVPKEDESGGQIVPFEPDILPSSTSSHNEFTREPYKFAAYIQDKIEYESLIINLGLRFDLFQANAHIPADPSDPNIYSPFRLQNIYKDIDGDGSISLEEQIESNQYRVAERENFWWKDTDFKTQLSPRLGVAYPITDKGVIHFSYGIFQQVPNYSLLYIADELKLSSGSGIQGPFGNPNLNPERTTMYELGLKQQLTNDLSIDVTGFYRDIRDWISTGQPIPTVLGSVYYAHYINRDFANVGGVTISVDKMYGDNFSFNIDYTYQIAEGTNSDPSQEFFAQLGGAEPTRILTPLNWDQRHSLNTNFFYGMGTWGVSLISRYDTGQPYTPTMIPGTRTGQNILSGLRENSRRKPNLFSIDLSAYKNFTIGAQNVQVFARVFNLLDSKNPVNIFGDTGDAEYTLQLTQAFMADDGWFVHPEFFSQPRRIQIGAKIFIN